jgi:hypothetical protein
MYQQNNNSNRFSPPVCVCGHAMNLHKYGKIDCNGSHSGTSFFSKGIKCKCLLFVDNNANSHQLLVPASSGGNVVLNNSIPPPRVEQNIVPPASSTTVRSKEDIQAMLLLLQEQLEGKK